MLVLADGGADRRRLRAREGLLQALLVGGARLAADRGEELIGREAEESRCRKAAILGLDDLARRPDHVLRRGEGRA